MVRFRWIHMSSLLILLPHLTAVTVQLSDLRVKFGNDATMLCGNGVDNHGKCDSVRWLYRRHLLPEDDQLLTRGRIIKDPADKSYRLSVTEDCSLVIRKVTFSDTGYYTCLQYKPPEHLQSIVELTVFTRGTTKPLSGTNAPSNLQGGAAGRKASATEQARTDCSVVDYIMLVLRVAELVLITVITVLLIRARGNQRPPDDNTVHHDGDRHDSTANYENIGGPSASVRIHTKTN